MSSYTNTVFSANFGLEPPATIARRLVRCNISQRATLPINSISADHINIHISYKKSSSSSTTTTTTAATTTTTMQHKDVVDCF